MLHIVDAQKALQVIDKYKQVHMVLAVFLLHRARKKVALCIVVNHGLRQKLVIVITLGLLEMLVQKLRHLIHVQIDIRDIIRTDIIGCFEILYKLAQVVFPLRFHGQSPFL